MRPSSSGSTSVNQRWQKGHWKSLYSRMTTGASGLPLMAAPRASGRSASMTKRGGFTSPSCWTACEYAPSSSGGLAVSSASMISRKTLAGSAPTMRLLFTKKVGVPFTPSATPRPSWLFTTPRVFGSSEHWRKRATSSASRSAYPSNRSSSIDVRGGGSVGSGVAVGRGVAVASGVAVGVMVAAVVGMAVAVMTGAAGDMGGGAGSESPPSVSTMASTIATAPSSTAAGVRK